MGNTVKFGLKNVHYSKITMTNGEEVYGTPVSIPGAVALSLSPKGETSEFYADDVVYFDSTSNLGYEGDLEIALIPDAFMKDILGFAEDSNGALVEDANATISAFALGFEIQGDSKARKTWLYNCKAGRPNNEGKTKENGKAPVTDKLSLTVKPRVTDSKVKISMVENLTNGTEFAAFFGTVYEAVQGA